MTDATRSEINALLGRGYDRILGLVRQRIPDVSMQMGDHHNDFFSFRSYAQYSAGERTIVISVDVKSRDRRLLFSSDIAQENGVVLKDVIDVSVDDNPEGENQLVGYAREFAATCESYAPLIAQELGTKGTA
jgi:hypothetical protein